MAEGRPGIFGSAARAFFGAFFGLLGIFVGIIVVVILLGLMAFSGTKEIEPGGRYTVLPNADGSKRELTSHSPLVLFIDVKGVVGTESLHPDEVRQQLERSQLGSFKGRVRAVMLNINSPGGSAFASDTIYRLVKDYGERYRVPVYAYVDGLCASGGIYIAAAAEKIYASEASLVGSVGVVANFMNVSGALDKIGVQTKIITQGTDKDAMNPLRPWKEGESKGMEEITAYYYKLFVDIMVENRKGLTRDKLVDEYGARVYPAPRAAEYDYIDGVINNRNEVLTQLVTAAGIQDEKYQVVQLEHKNWLDQLFRGQHPFLRGQIEHKFDLPGALPTGYLYLYQPGQ